jgi:universal stress protein A
MPPMAETESAASGGTAIRIERIVCPVDFSEISANTYGYAQSIARHYRAKLILQHVVELWQHPSANWVVNPECFDEFRQTLISNSREQLRQLVNLYGGIQPEVVIEESMAADAILSLARARAANLLVMGTHGRRGFDHLMLGSVTERVLRHAPCPVLAVPGKRPDEAGNGPGADYVRRILCCVDFSVID